MQWKTIDEPLLLDMPITDPEKDLVSMEYLALDRSSAGGEVDRIGLRHFMPASSRRVDSQSMQPICVYLPGRFANANLVFNDYRYDLRQYLARESIHVYCMDYRTHFLKYEIEQEKQRCGTWNTGTFLTDIAEAIRFVRQRHGERKVVLIGHSMGCTLAYFYAAANSEQNLAGLIALDGGVKSPNPPPQHKAFNFSEELDILRQKGLMISEQFGSFQKFRSRLQQAMDPGQAQSRHTHLLRTYIELLLDGKGEPVMGWPRGSMSNLSGGIGSLDLLLAYLESHDGYWPMVQVLEARAISYGYTDEQLPRYDRGLETIAVPLLNVVALGRGESHHLRNLYSSRLCTQAAQTELLLEGFGHLDVIVCPQVEQKVMQPILQWLLKLESEETI